MLISWRVYFFSHYHESGTWSHDSLNHDYGRNGNYDPFLLNQDDYGRIDLTMIQVKIFEYIPAPSKWCQVRYTLRDGELITTFHGTIWQRKLEGPGIKEFLWKLAIAMDPPGDT